MAVRRRALAALALALAAQRASADAGPPAAPVLRVEAGAHTAVIRAVGADAEGRWLATASDDKTARVWELRTGALVRVLRPPVGEGREGALYAVAMSPDGQLVAAGGHTGAAWTGSYVVYVFERATGRLVRRVAGLPRPPASLAFSPDGRWLAAGLLGDGGVRVFRADTFSLVGEDASCGGATLHVEFAAGGLLVATSLDGFVRLYQVAPAGVDLLARGAAIDGARPRAASLSPDGRLLAVGYADSARVHLFHARTLDGPFDVPTNGLGRGSITGVAWSAETGSLFAAGSARRDLSAPVRRWLDAGRGGFADLPGAAEAVTDLRALPGGRVAFGASDPAWGVLDASGRRALLVGSPVAEFPRGPRALAVSADGTSVRFAYDRAGRSPARVDVRAGTVTPGGGEAPGPPGRPWSPPAQGLRPVAASVSGDGRVAVAALPDGTIRWYRASDGAELLALFPHADRKRWVLWTPDGYYAASPGGDDLLGWHVNRGPDEAADFFPLSLFRDPLHRPDVVARVLDTLDEAVALRAAGADPAPRSTPASSAAGLLPPVVEILSPGDGATFSGDALALPVKVRLRAPPGAPPRALLVRVNGRAVRLPDEADLLAQAERGLELSVPLLCEDTEVQILAENRSGWSAPATVRLACEAGR